ncbi:Major capsid protein Gp5 [uncultured Caudovirales phage]|uniref:Major capsid protein Gp5 n=1 Tax=uncultured Caudovirales phage TaxID=2100421 RepID=A0A6J5MF04_9CAUD|nr:Major capsid protein Gp5 [uncultured Caudovirales phage]CAB4189238.1 Major capsid protein Gp5 [uncultured Caudovirales phage]
MALASFKGSIWSAAIQASLDNTLVAGALVNTSYAGEIGRNKSVVVNKIGALSAVAYDGTTPLSAAALTSTSQSIVVDQAQAVAFKLDDADAAQISAPVLAEATAKAGRTLAQTIDAYLINEMWTDAGADLGEKTISSTYSAYDLLSDLAVELDGANTPADGRFVIVSPAFAALLSRDARLNRATVAGDDVARTGNVGEAAGFRVYKTNQASAGAVLAGHSVSTAFINQVTVTEAVRAADFFADVVRTMALYGAKVIEPGALAKATWIVD